MGKAGRPPKLPREKTAVYVEIPDDVLAGLDAWVDELQVSVPGGAGITRPDLIRDLLAKALREHQQARRPKRR